ncbi:uncharacterized protein BO66DRAFT_395037 [Aspergillus aculeatinus CBS 121060]|uniref:Uncharacterized protein n=1 Tax=Aspergillus aculeatinus CBS 121060 TaxID=1448322 RepID=A0ACD1GX88_9EURO|nr:hypothetical protein BO66DRAFT_395037 [Aspergillus aculeatinus CBS 121060]RAH65898.1 hypothetical protein BO66DRAFT_395037 [Aspergillus aculeatinus CBS 121060]
MRVKPENPEFEDRVMSTAEDSDPPIATCFCFGKTNQRLVPGHGGDPSFPSGP